MKKKLKGYFWGLLIALDQLLNAFLAGYPDETFSARCFRQKGQKLWGLMAWIIDGLFFFEPGHCQKSFEAERARQHSPAEWRAAHD